MPQTNQDLRSFVVNADGTKNSFWPTGNKPPPSAGGSLANLRWTAPSGLVDGEEIIVDTSAFSFETPENFNYLGFGAGWMYSNPVGTQLQSHNTTTAFGSRYWEYEYDATPNREIILDGGIRHLKAKIWASTGTDYDAGGMVNFDTGRATTAGDRLIQYSRGRINVGSGSSIPSAFQLKEERMGAYKNTSTNTFNSAYLKHYGSEHTLDAYTDAGVGRDNYYDRGLNKDGAAFTQLWQWKQNTPSVADGSHILISSQANLNSGLIERKVFSLLDSVGAGAAERARWIKWQSFCGNRTGQFDVDWLCTDFFAQLNGSVFVIANQATITSGTQICPLVPTEFTSSTSWKMRLWRGGVTSGYETTYLHLMDSNMLSLASQQLQNGVI